MRPGTTWLSGIGALALAGALTAADQPVLLPMPRLLQQLDARQEWLLLPLAEWQALVRSGQDQGSTPISTPSGGWIEQATISANLVEDREVQCTATLIAVAPTGQPSRCPLFATTPVWLGEPRIGNAPGLWLASDAGVDLVLPAGGRHPVQLSWSVPLTRMADGDHDAKAPASAGGFATTLQLPLAAGTDLRVTSTVPGSVSAPGMVAAAGDPSSWRLAGRAPATMPLWWLPGRRDGGGTLVQSAVQQATITIDDAGVRSLRWRADLTVHRGDHANVLDLRLPPGWHLTRPIAGVSELTSDGPQVRLRMIPGSAELVVDGWCQDDAPVALPRIAGIAIQPGMVQLISSDPIDYHLPAGWRVATAAIGSRTFAIPVAGDGVSMPWSVITDQAPPAVTVDAVATISTDPAACTIAATMAISANRRFDCPIELPVGWRLRRFHGDEDLRLAGWAPGDEITDVGPGHHLLRARQGFPAPRQVLLELVPTANADADSAPRTLVVTLPTVPAARASHHRLRLLAGAAIDTAISAGARWRGQAGDPDPEERARMELTGDPTPVTVVIRARAPSARADLVASLAPERERTWMRLDLRVEVVDGLARELVVEAPFAALPSVSAGQAGDDPVIWQAASTTAGWRLTPNRSWNGVQLLRLEGELVAAMAGQLPRPLIRLASQADQGEAPPTTLLVLLHAAADGEVEVLPDGGWTPQTVDDLPTWTVPAPGEPVVAVLRAVPAGSMTASANAAGWHLRTTAAVPVGTAFIDQLDLRTRIARDQQRTLARFRLAAPQLSVLPIRLPTGAHLVEATIDGRSSPLRRRGDTVELPLPGRTQVQVALLIDGPAPEVGTWLPTTVALEPPTFADLPVTRTGWTIGIDDGLIARPAVSLGTIPLTSQGSVWQRSWFAGWHTAGTSVMETEPSALANASSQTMRDPRILLPVVSAVEVVGEPHLRLPGQRCFGTRLGAGAAAHLSLGSIDALRQADRWGIVLAGLLAFALLGLGRRRMLGAGIAALAVAAAIHLAGWFTGPLLALGEALVPALVVLVVIHRAWRLVRPVPVAPVTALLLVGLSLFPLTGAEPPTPVLMGYQRLDAQGRPVDPVVAVDRERFTALWQRAQPTRATAAAVCALATGAPRYEFAFITAADRAQAQGHLRLAYAVPGETWQMIRLPVIAGSVRGCLAESFADRRQLPVAWRTVSDPTTAIEIDLPPRSSGELVFDLEFVLTAESGRWLATVPLPALPGGTLQARRLIDWRLEVDGRGGRANGEDTRWDLIGGAAIQLVWQRAHQASSGIDQAMTLAQQVRVELHPGRLSWQAIVDTGGIIGMHDLTWQLPTGLVVTRVTGDGLADWRQDGRQLVLHRQSGGPGQRTTVEGFIPRSAAGSGTAAVLITAPATVLPGRIELRHGHGARFASSFPSTFVAANATTAPTRSEVTAGNDLAFAWSQDPGPIAVAWASEPVELRGQVGAVVSMDQDQVRIDLSVRLSGRGTIDALSWSLPDPWQLVDRTGIVVGRGAERRLVLRQTTGAWHNGALATVAITAPRIRLGERFRLPAAEPVAEGCAVDRAQWLFGGDGAGRLRLVDAAALDARPVASIGGTIPLADQSAAWQFAGIATGAPIDLAIEPAAPRVTTAQAHYLVLAQDRLRWWARIDYAVDGGTIDELRCTLPPLAQVTAVRTRDLGQWTRSGRELVVRLATPLRTRQTLEIDLELPLGADATVEAVALSTPWPGTRQVVALVDEEGLGLLHTAPQGLVEAGAPQAGDLPGDVAADQVTHRWSAERPDWWLRLSREAVGGITSGDGVVTLLDGLTTVTGDGESRSHATWHVVNRSRTRLRLELPPAVELWQVRVDGRVVTPRRAMEATADDRTLMIPVIPLRPGGLATRIELAWRAPAAGPGRVVLDPPRLPELGIVQTVWRCSPPTGWQVRCRDGALREIEPAAAARLRARRVLDDVARLERQDGLNDAALRRQGESLALLDQELTDHLVAMQRIGERLAPQTADGEYEAWTTINSSIGEQQRVVRKAQEDVTANLSKRTDRRNKLLLGQNSLSWMDRKSAAAPVPVEPGLGAGQPPPGWRTAGAAGLLGIDLVAEQDGEVLELGTQGADLRTELSIAEQRHRWIPWAVGVVGLGLALAIVLSAPRGQRRRSGGGSDTPTR